MTAAPTPSAPAPGSSESTTALEPASSRGAPVHPWRRFLRNPLSVAAAAVVLVVAIVAVLGRVLAPYDPNFADLTALLAPPGPEHPLGTDRAGRDVLSRLLAGTQVTLLASALAVAIAMLIGVPSGLIAGFYGRWFDTLSGWTSGLLMSLPAMVVLLAVRAVAGPSVWTSMLVFGVVLSPSFYRLVRSSVVTVRSELYVDAARVSGLSDARIISRHVLGVVRAPIIVQAALVASLTIAVQSGLEFLGIGDRDVPTWGNLLNDAFQSIYSTPSLIVWPAGAVTITCVAFGVLANGIRDAYEDRGTPVARGRKAPPTSALRTVGAGVPADPDAVLSVRGLRVGYPLADGTVKVVVDGVDLDVRRGEVLGLVGESGSGKSQTSFAVLDLLPTGGRVLDGTISVLGETVAGEGSVKGRAAAAKLRGTGIGYVPQEPLSNLDPNYTIGHQLTEPLRSRLGLGKKEAKARAIDLLARVHIRDPHRTFDAYPHEISGGMAQRVLIAGAVSCNPRLLIADEPTTALDVTVQAEVLELLRELQRDLDLAVLIVTHNFGVVADICDRVAVMRSGRIVETAPVERLFAAPAHEYTRTLLAATLDDAPARTPLHLERGHS